MFGTILSLATGGFHLLGWLPLLAGPAAIVGALFCKPMLKALLVAGALLIIGGYIAVLKIDIATQAVTIATDAGTIDQLKGFVVTAQNGEAAAVAANKASVASWNNLKAGYLANIAALAKQRDTLAAQVKTLSANQVGSSINADLKVCPGPIPLPMLDVLGRLRGT